MKQWSFLSLFLIVGIISAPLHAHIPHFSTGDRQPPRKESRIKQFLKDNIANICIVGALGIAVLYTILTDTRQRGHGGKPPAGTEPIKLSDEELHAVCEKLRAIKVDGLNRLGLIGINPTDDELNDVSYDDFKQRYKKLFTKTHPDKQNGQPQITQLRNLGTFKNVEDVKGKLDDNIFWPENGGIRFSLNINETYEPLRFLK